jgi:hypothetical protein
MPPIRYLLGAAVLLLHSAPVAAHHSYVMFDQTRSATVQGTVHALEWTNPHAWVWVAVKDDAGATVIYGFETNAPSELARSFGWSKAAVEIGASVTVEYSPLKSGRHGGALRTLTFSDGRVLRTPRSDATYRTGPPAQPPANAPHRQ